MPVANRLLGKVDLSDPLGCWEWQASTSNGGYGQFKLNGTMARAHRVSYELFVGQIPDGMVLDHLCRNRRCVNPAHLEAVTQDENMARGARATATHCSYGHEFTPENTRHRDRKNGERVCRTCVKRRKAERRARLKNLAGTDSPASSAPRHPPSSARGAALSIPLSWR